MALPDAEQAALPWSGRLSLNLRGAGDEGRRGRPPMAGLVTPCWFGGARAATAQIAVVHHNRAFAATWPEPGDTGAVRPAPALASLFLVPFRTIHSVWIPRGDRRPEWGRACGADVAGEHGPQQRLPHQQVVPLSPVRAGLAGPGIRAQLRPGLVDGGGASGVRWLATSTATGFPTMPSERKGIQAWASLEMASGSPSGAPEGGLGLPTIGCRARPATRSPLRSGMWTGTVATSFWCTTRRPLHRETRDASRSCRRRTTTRSSTTSRCGCSTRSCSPHRSRTWRSYRLHRMGPEVLRP